MVVGQAIVEEAWGIAVVNWRGEVLVGGRRRKRRFRKSVWPGPHGDSGDEGEECADGGGEGMFGGRKSRYGV